MATSAGSTITRTVLDTTYATLAAELCTGAAGVYVCNALALSTCNVLQQPGRKPRGLQRRTDSHLHTHARAHPQYIALRLARWC
jgi:hypothetical protein